MLVVGFCTVGFHVRYIEATDEQVKEALRTGEMIEGVCGSCRREREREVMKQ